MQSRQSGLALLALLLVTSALVALLFLSAYRPTNYSHQQATRTEAALANAKAALIDYAVTYAENHPSQPLAGLLPCPDEGPSTWTGPEREGIANSTCGIQSVSRLGRLPFTTLGIAPLRDGAQECLWYAVSGTYKNSPIVSGLFNWDVPGLLRVIVPTQSNSSTPLTPGAGSDVVAVVFAPGPAIDQNRFTSRIRHPDQPDAPQCGGNYVSANYLEVHTAIGATNQATSPVPGAISTFFGSPTPPTLSGSNPRFNDNVAFVTRKELWDAIERSQGFRKRLNSLMQTVATCLVHYPSHPTMPPIAGDRRLPWAVNVIQSPPHRYTDSNNFGYADQSGHLMGRVPIILSASNTDTLRSAAPSDLPATCPAAVWSAEQALQWRHWKDHFFVAIANDFRPLGVVPHTRCTANEQCLHVNTEGPFAAVLLFAGRALNGQTRDGASRGDVANYLEGNNRTSAPNTMGNATFESRANVDATFNDRVICVRPDLSFAEC